METFIASVITLACGYAVAAASYYVAKIIMKKNIKLFYVASVLRQVLQIGYLVAVYFALKALNVNLMVPFVFAALGITVPLFYFTKKLVVLSNEKGNSEGYIVNNGEAK